MLIIFFSPLINDYLRHCEAFKQLPIQTFISEFSVKTLNMSLFPWRSKGDANGFDIKIF